MPELSIIIVSWNARDFLRRCLATARATPTGAAAEIIVVDNGSDDGSPEMVEREFPGVVVIRNGANLGFARANNIGLRRATGRFLALVNSDVETPDDCFRTLIDYLMAHPGVGLVGPRALNADGSLQPSCRRLPTLGNRLSRALALDAVFPRSRRLSGSFMKYWAHDATRPVEVLSGFFWLARREAVDAVGLLDERFYIYGEDVDWCRRFAAGAWDVVFVHTARAIHFGGASSRRAPVRFFLEMQRANSAYWRKHHGRAGQLVFLCILALEQSLRLAGAAALWLAWPARRGDTGYKIERAARCLTWIARGAPNRSIAPADPAAAPAAATLGNEARPL